MVFKTLKNKKYPKSLAYTSKGCPPGYHKRASYLSTSGKLVPARCIRSTTVYKETSKQFKLRTLGKAASRLRRAGITSTTVKAKNICPPGQVLRKAYVRKYTTAIRKRGYTVRRGDQVFRAYPSEESTIVQAACVKDRGLPGKGPQVITPLRRGELRKYGYIYKEPLLQRKEALRKAIEAYGALGVYRKLDAVAKLAKRSAPKAAKVFREDRDWVRVRFGPLKAFK
jgi:hypothetical protein